LLPPRSRATCLTIFRTSRCCALLRGLQRAHGSPELSQQPVLLLLSLGQQGGNLQVERLGNGEQALEARLPQPPFDLANVAHVQSGPFRELLLRELQLFTSGSYPSANRF